MKTMTCHQLGGPCEVQLFGDTADQIIKAQDRHLRDAVKSGDSTHEQAHAEMKGRWKHPKQSMEWYTSAKQQFAESPESAPETD